MPAFKEEYLKEADDMRRQDLTDWKERVLQVEEPFIKTKEQKESEERAHEQECLKTFNELCHQNPQWHLNRLAEELEWETFCLLNKIPYSPGYKNGMPGYWNYRQLHGEEWMLNTRQKLPNE